MSQSTADLESVVDGIESKASEYDEATNYEAKKQQYLNSLSSVEDALSRLERRVEQLEFLTSVLTKVHKEDLPISGAVEDARRNARSVVDRDIDDFYKLAEEGREDQYDQKIQQAIGKVNTARKEVKNNLRDVESEWKDDVETARSVQKLVGESSDMMRTLSKIEAFVDEEMWETSEGVLPLKLEWEELMEEWESGEVGWDSFKQDHDLSDSTMEVLKELAKEGEIQLDELNDDITDEMLSVEPLRKVVRLSI